MEKLVFGFDLGIASIGWSVIVFDDEFYNIETGEVIAGKILKSGVRCFPIAENPKDGTSLATPRREKRLGRKLCRRKQRRMEGLKGLFCANGLVKADALKAIYENQVGGDVWNLRIKALSEKLENAELVRVLTHLAKHRGFKSYRQAAEQEDAEGGKVLKAIKANKEFLTANKTLAQVIVERAGDGKKRNSTGQYQNSIPREEIEKEVAQIFAKQKDFGLFTPKLYEDFCKIAFRYRPINGVEDMVGDCRFEDNEKRAPKEAPSAELFVARSKINNMMVWENHEKRFLDEVERQAIIDLLKESKEVKYATIAKKLFKNKEIKFADIDYAKTTKKDKKGEIKTINPEDEKFYSLKGWHKLKAAFDEKSWGELSCDILLLDKIVEIVATQKNDADIVKKMQEHGTKSDYIKAAQKLNFKEFIHLSLKALYKLNPYLEQGLKYNEACEKSGYDFKDTGSCLVEKSGRLLEAIPEIKLTNNPVVNRTISQFRKVYNAMVRQFGEPDQINLEMGRDLKRNHDERREIEEKNKKNRDERALSCEELVRRNLNANAKNVLKYRLYQEQDGKCIYSGNAIDINRLDENGYCEIDHIIPYSRSLDDGYHNKVLCLSEENQNKSNQTPFEYLPAETWHDFKIKIGSMMGLGRRKKDNLLSEHFADRELEFRDRNANDNSYIASYIKQYLEDGIDFSHSQWKIKNRIQTRNGALTDYLRHQWGLKKDRDESDLHHAQDAIVVACATQEMVTYLSTVSNFFEAKIQLINKKGEAWYKSLKYKFAEPWPRFREDVQTSLQDIFVSRPARKNASGSAHRDTIAPLSDKNGIEIRKGQSIRENMFRCDIYRVGNQYKIVPIYVIDLVNKDFKHQYQPMELGADGLAIEAKADDYLFSLYKDDYVEINTNDSEKFVGYFSQYNAQNGQLYLDSIDGWRNYKIKTKTFEIGDWVSFDASETAEVFLVTRFDVSQSELVLTSLSNKQEFRKKAGIKVNKKGEVSKNIETEQSLIKLDKLKKVSFSTFKKLQKFQVDMLGNIVEIKKEKERFCNKVKPYSQKIQERRLKKLKKVG